MNAETWAQLTLATYAAACVVTIWWLAGRCEHGRIVSLLYVVNRLMSGLIFHCRGSRRCPFPDDGPALIVANHRSPADPMLVWMNHHLVNVGNRRRIRAINFLMAREFYELPSMNWMYRALRCIPVDRDAKEAAPVRDAIRRLRAGELVGIFPEGRINTGEGLLTPGGTGIAFLALKSRVPVYPVFIQGSPQAKSMVSCFMTPSRVRLIYGDPIDLSQFYDHPKPRECFDDLTKLLMRRLAELGGIDATPTADDQNAATIPLDRAAQ
jgi:1-acyl-sn-glycerol-3-phosphate acyltransferase